MVIKARLPLALLILLLAAPGYSETSQEGSLNNSYGQESTVNSHNQTSDTSTSNTYNGAGSSSEIPPPSAISPSYISNGVETCLQGIGSSVQTVVVGWSKGKYKADEDCNRRRDAALLKTQGMMVASVARHCQSLDVWKAMFVSGTPCPLLSGGKLVVGKRAYLVMKRQPEVYIPDYGPKTKDWYNTILKIGEPLDEDKEDITSMSAKFRPSSK